MGNALKTPREYNLPAKFIDWRPHQKQAIDHLSNSDKQFILQIQPTGSGKSLCYITDAILTKGRTLILTSGKGLQDQLAREFGSTLSLAVVKGKNAHRCRKLQEDSVPYFASSCDWGPCNFGVPCEYRVKGCNYYDHIRRAKACKIVVTNYSFWGCNKPDTLGEFALLVCDEAHDSLLKLLGVLAFCVTRKEFDQVRLQGVYWPKPGFTNEEYWDWSEEVYEKLSDYLTTAKQELAVASLVKDPLFRARRKLHMKLKKLEGMTEPQWHVEVAPYTLMYDPIWPANFSREYLFRDIPKVLMTSATVTPKVLELLGIDKKDVDKVEYPSHFPKESRPISWIKTVRMWHKMSNAEMRTWLSRIDQIIRTRLDRKGIIHAVSYARCERIMNVSDYSSYMYLHDSRDIQEVVAQFKKAKPPAILVSPSVVTGYDFPYTECEYQIIGKIPFQDLRKEVDKKRKKLDPEFGVCFAAQNLVQAAGRGMRAEDDKCEVFIIDDMFGWFQVQYNHFMPQWFKETVRQETLIPKPLEKLI